MLERMRALNSEEWLCLLTQSLVFGRLTPVLMGPMGEKKGKAAAPWLLPAVEWLAE